MKKVILAALCCFLATAVSAQAATVRGPSDGNTIVTEDINDDLYVSGLFVSLRSHVQGEVFATGAQVSLEGSVSENILAFGGNISAGGSVARDLRIAGGNVTLNTQVGEDLLIFGGQVTTDGGLVGQDLLVSAGNFNLVNTPVAGRVYINGGQVFINSPIEGSVSVNAESLTLGPNAAINGNLSYRSPTEAVFQPGSSVRGRINFQQTPERPAGIGLFLFGLFVFVIKLTGWLLIALLLVYLVPGYSDSIVSFEGYWQHLGLGFAVFICIPAAIIILFGSVVGWVLAWFLCAAYASLVIIAGAYAGIIAGSHFTKYILGKHDFEATWLEAVIGIPLLLIIVFIPFIGWLVWFFFFLLAFGRMLFASYQSYNRIKA